jgi:subtilisin family serine protease
VYATATQTNPSNWGLDRIDSLKGFDSKYIYAYTGAGVNAYILDTPVANQVEFEDRFGSCTSFTKEDCVGFPAINFHGSHVAGKPSA